MQNLPGCVKVVAHLIIFCFQLVALPFALVVASSEAVLCWPVFRAATDVEGDDPREMQLLRWRCDFSLCFLSVSLSCSHCSHSFFLNLLPFCATQADLARPVLAGAAQHSDRSAPGAACAARRRWVRRMVGDRKPPVQSLFCFWCVDLF